MITPIRDQRTKTKILSLAMILVVTLLSLWQQHMFLQHDAGYNYHHSHFHGFVWKQRNGNGNPPRSTRSHAHATVLSNESVISNTTIASVAAIPLDAKSTSRGLAACLMLKNDNAILFEWLAYHYTVLPLRYLVIGVDFNNSQDPMDVLHFWRSNRDVNHPNHNDDDLQYWILPPEQFAHRHGHFAMREDDPNEDMHQLHHHALIHRQKGFITSCIERLVQEVPSVTWTLFIDSDEYIMMNSLEPLEHDMIRIHDSGNSANWTRGTLQSTNNAEREYLRMRSYLLSNHTNATIMEILGNMRREEYQRSKLLPNPACYTMPRLLVGALENRTCSEYQPAMDLYQTLFHNSSSNSVNPTNSTHLRSEHTTGTESNIDATDSDHVRLLPFLTTLRFVQHAPKGNFAYSKFGKVIMDLSTISRDQIASTRPSNIHRPWRNNCGPAVVPYHHAVFVVHHYIGRWTNYKSRGLTDARRDRKSWEQRATVNHGIQCDMAVAAWFPRFVQAVGRLQVQRWMQDKRQQQNQQNSYKRQLISKTLPLEPQGPS